MSPTLPQSIAERLHALAPGTSVPDAGSTLATLAALLWPPSVRYTVGDREIAWTGHRLQTRRGEVWCVAELSEQLFLIAEADDASSDPSVYTVDHDELSSRSDGQPLSRWLASVKAEPLRAPEGVTFESASVDEARVLLRLHAKASEPDERARLTAMAKRYLLGEIVDLRLGWGETDFSDVLTDRHFWPWLFAGAERRGRFLEAETTAALRSHDEALRLRAVAHLARQGARGIPQLTTLTKDKALAVALAATRAIASGASEADRALLEALVKDKRPEIASAALVAVVRALGEGAADAVADAVTRRPADASFALLEASGFALVGSVDADAATLADVVAWAAKASKGAKKKSGTSLEIGCDLDARAGRLRAQVQRTVQGGKPLPTPLDGVLLHLAPPGACDGSDPQKGSSPCTAASA